jgi:hypothetical protein
LPHGADTIKRIASPCQAQTEAGLMYYRSYGLVLVLIAGVVVAGRFRDNTALASTIAGLVLLVDLPIRFLGNIVPWHEYDVPLWPFSPYRGSHVFLIPTWLWGVAAIGIGLACFVSPRFQAFLDRKEPPRPIVQEPPAPIPPPIKKPAEPFEVELQELQPHDGRNFYYTLHNRTGQRLDGVEVEFHFASTITKERKENVRVAHLNPGESRGQGYHIHGIDCADWLRVRVKARHADQREFTAERAWDRSK